MKPDKSSDSLEKTEKLNETQIYAYNGEKVLKFDIKLMLWSAIDHKVGLISNGRLIGY